MGEGRAVDVMRRMHRLPAKGRCRILDKGDVVAELHPEPCGRFNARIREHSNNYDFADAVHFQLVIEVRVCKSALRPMLLDDNVAILRLEIGMKLAAPGAFGKGLGFG
ncbi:hypothetical protein PUR_20140 [Paenibacillus sp. URB8-2]|nr:hypothetical protein [Paenibacillus sp. URB8-2]BCG58589.1 hypothetical protein PUR_20140 [Paenibacillus sp. URB8-2]